MKRFKELWQKPDFKIAVVSAVIGTFALFAQLMRLFL